MIQRIKTIQPSTAIIIITGYSDVKTAVQTFKHGANDYVVKPLYPDEILMTINETLSRMQSKVRRHPSVSHSNGKQHAEVNYIPGKSAQAEMVQRYINLIAPAEMSVIITGETGTGKEFVAKAIHKKSHRHDKSFVAIDCGALPKELAGSELFGHLKGSFTGAIADKPGNFELAHLGTLFLDEVGNLSYENQVKLLRVLQERKIRRIGGTNDIAVDVRIIAATNEDLAKAVQLGKFREDLYHRLNEFKIDLAPLRQRQEDILLFAGHFLEMANQLLNKQVRSFAPQVEERLATYEWYGNLRELNNVVKRAVLLSAGDQIELESLPTEILNSSLNGAGSRIHLNGTRLESNGNLLKSVTGNAEREAIIDVLEKTGYNKSRAAEVLKIDRKTLYNKLKAYEIKL
jgi:two-component system response regulator HydG